MEKRIYDETNGLWYELQEDCYLPCLAVPEQPSIGIWGERHRQHLRKHKRGIYSGLLLSGKLDAYLADIDQQATVLFDRLTKEMAECEGITEALKATDQMAWVGAMNSMRQKVMEIVNRELIFA